MKRTIKTIIALFTIVIACSSATHNSFAADVIHQEGAANYDGPAPIVQAALPVQQQPTYCTFRGIYLGKNKAEACLHVMCALAIISLLPDIARAVHKDITNYWEHGLT